MNLAKEIERLDENIEKLETLIQEHETKIKDMDSKIQNNLKTSSDSNVRRWNFPKKFHTPWQKKK